MAKIFNPPPNWPVPPKDWTPPKGWTPHPGWGKPPTGWKLWIERKSEIDDFGLRPESASSQLPAWEEIPYGVHPSLPHGMNPNVMVAGASIIALGLTGYITSPPLQSVLINPTDAERQAYYEAQQTPYVAPTEGVSFDLDKIKGKPPKVFEGEFEETGTFSSTDHTINLEKPDGEDSVAWVEYEFTVDEGMYRSTDARLTAKADFENVTEDISTINIEFPDLDAEEEPQTVRGSFWLTGTKNFPINIYSDPGRWKFTVHSAKDAPVLKPGDRLAGGDGPVAFRYTSSAASNVTMTNKEVAAPDSQISRRLNVTLNWLNAPYKADDSRRGITKKIIEKPMGNNTGSTDLLPGDYLMSVIPPEGMPISWSLDFASDALEHSSDAPEFALTQKPLTSVEGEGSRADVSLKTGKNWPYVLSYQGTTDFVDHDFNIKSRDEKFYVYPTGVNKTLRGVVVVNDKETAESLNIDARNGWKVESYAADALPTYGPGDRVRFDGPAAFYWDGSEEKTVTVHHKHSGELNVASDFALLDLPQQKADHSSLDRILYKSQQTEATSTFTLPKGKPMLIQVDTEAGNAWDIAF